jgi:hypothetical protein
MVICSWYSGGRIGVLQTWSSCNALMCAVYHQEKGRVHWVTPAALLSIIFLHPSLVLCLILCCHYFVSLFCLHYSIKRWHWILSEADLSHAVAVALSRLYEAAHQEKAEDCAVYLPQTSMAYKNLPGQNLVNLFHSVSSPMRVSTYSWVNASFLPWSTCYCRHCIHWGGG